MIERHKDTLEYFVSPAAPEGGDGTLHHPYRTLSDALQGIRENGHALGDPNDGWSHRSLEIACVERPGGSFTPGRKPKYHFHVDTHASGEGDGSDLNPWVSLNVALASLQSRTGPESPLLATVIRVHVVRAVLALLAGIAGFVIVFLLGYFSFATQIVLATGCLGVGLLAAVRSMFAMQRAATETGSVALIPGQRLFVSLRAVFTATKFEKRKKVKELLAGFVFFCMAMVLVAPVLLIFGYLLVQAWPTLSAEFLFSNPRDRMTAGGIWAPLIGTFFLVLISLLVAAPIGVLAGVYLNEYARDNWLTRVINLAVVNLAGVPSIVHALFGVGAFVLFFHMGRSMLAASCTVAVMTLPVIITSSREALAAVPMSFREACWNMGASRWQTIRTIVLPNSIAGILTGVILQVARAAGETAPILFTGAVFFVPVADSGFAAWMPYGLGDRFMALSMHLFTLTTQVKGVAEEIQYGTAVVLIGLVLVVNSVSIAVRIYLRSRKKW